MLSFSYPWVLIFIPFIFVFWIFFSKEKWWNKPPNILLQKFAIKPKEFYILWVIRFFIICSFFIILSWWQVTFSQTKEIKQPNNIMIVFDISRSMLAEDILPNRIARAKQSLQKFIHTRKDDNIWLIVFAGKPFLIANNSTDTNWINYFLEKITPNYILQEKPELSGTNIWDALLLASDHLKKFEWEKNIILITDGSANTGIDPEVSTQEIVTQKIHIYTIGIWTKNNEPIFYTNSLWQKIYFYDEKWEKIIWDLDDNILKKISNATNGKYFSSENIESLENTFSSINAKISNNFYTEELLQKFSLTPILLVFLIFFINQEGSYQKKFFQKYNLLEH